MILTDLFNTQNSQNIFQATSCLQIICFQFGCVFNCLLSIILCCCLEEQKFLQQRKREIKLPHADKHLYERRTGSACEVKLWFSCRELMEAASTSRSLPWFTQNPKPPGSLPFTTLVFPLNVPWEVSHSTPLKHSVRFTQVSPHAAQIKSCTPALGLSGLSGGHAHLSLTTSVGFTTGTVVCSASLDGLGVADLGILFLFSSLGLGV